jgi:hypothetical protein
VLSKTRELKTHSKILIMLIKKRVIIFEFVGDSRGEKKTEKPIKLRKVEKQ